MKKVPAIPPSDYRGSIAAWITALVQRELWDGIKPIWYGQVKISSDTWWEILEECENE